MVWQEEGNFILSPTSGPLSWVGSSFMARRALHLSLLHTHHVSLGAVDPCFRLFPSRTVILEGNNLNDPNAHFSGSPPGCAVALVDIHTKCWNNSVQFVFQTETLLVCIESSSSCVSHTVVNGAASRDGLTLSCFHSQFLSWPPPCPPPSQRTDPDL